jgi:D-arabinose 5-phosphate isomerase GutQ
MSSAAADVLDVARAFILGEAEAVRNLADQLDDSFLDCVRRIHATTGKVVTTGAGTSGLIASRFAHLLAVSGTPAFYLASQDALHGGMGAITPDDIVVAFSKGGQSVELTGLVVRLGERGVHVIAVTERTESPFAAAAATVAQVITNPSDADAGGLIAMGSTLVAGAWGDAVAVSLMRLNNFSWSEVINAHPAGIVGQQTTLPGEMSVRS